VVRVLLGWEWFQAGWHKMTGGGWLDGGEALKGFWTGIVKVPETGRAPITYDWYRSFIQGLLDTGSYVWFAKLIAIGETAIGIALVVLVLFILFGFAAGLAWEHLVPEPIIELVRRVYAPRET
jgi:thiosulfate dehydrogenase [quinone] large subunit